MRRLAQRDIDDLLALAHRGGIGQATALTDCVAEGPDQLMYMTDDTLVLLKDEGEELLAYCEGEVGWVKRRNILLGACASSSSPTLSVLDTPGDLQDLQGMNLDGVHIDDEIEHTVDPETLKKKSASTGGRNSGPFELESSRDSHDGALLPSPQLVQESSFGAVRQNGCPQTQRGAHARSASDASSASSARSSGSGPIGRLILGGGVKSDQTHNQNPYEASSLTFSNFSNFPSHSPPASKSALPPLRSLASGQNVRSVQRINYATTAPIRRQSQHAETARCESVSSDIHPMETTEEVDEEETLPIIDIKIDDADGQKDSPSPPTRPPRRRPVDLSITRNSQFSDTSTARVSDSPAPQTPRSLDTFGGEGIRSREQLVSPDRSMKSGGTRDSDLRTSYVGGMFSSDNEHDEGRTEALLSPAAGDEESRFSLAYLRDSYGEESEASPRRPRFDSPVAARFTALPLSASPPASSDSHEQSSIPRFRATPSQDGTEETILVTPQSAPVSSFGKSVQPRVMGSQSSDTSLAAPLIIDEQPTIDHLSSAKPQPQDGLLGSPSHYTVHDSPTSVNSRFSVESQAAAKASLRENFYALGHSPHITSQQQQSWRDASASLASAVKANSPASASAPLQSTSPSNVDTTKSSPQVPTPPTNPPRRKASLDAIRPPRSDDSHRMVFSSPQPNNLEFSAEPTRTPQLGVERLDDRSSHGWSHTPFPARQQASAFNGLAPPNGTIHAKDTNGNATFDSANTVQGTPPRNGQSPWAQQRNIAAQRTPPAERMRPTTPDQRVMPNGDYSRQIMSPSSNDDHQVQVVARPLDAFQQPPRNLTPTVATPRVLDYGKFSLSNPQNDTRPPIPAFLDQPPTRRGGTPTGDRPNTPTFAQAHRARSRSFSAAIAKTIGRSRKRSFDMPMPTAVVDTARHRSESPAMAMRDDRIPSHTLQLPTAKLRPGHASRSSVTAIHHMAIDGDSPAHEPPLMPFLGRTASGPRPSVDTIASRPGTGMKGQYGVGVSHRDFLDPTVKTDGMEFELVQPRKTPNGAPMVSLRLDSNDLSLGSLLASDFGNESVSSHGGLHSSSDHHFDVAAPPEVDEWGFIKECSPTPVIFQSRQPPSEVRAAEQRWLEIISKPLMYQASAPKKVRRLVVEQGIPASLRGRVWDWFMSNGLSGRVDGLFSRLLTNEPGEFDEQIDRDVSRVYCDHGAFYHRNSPGQADLRTLLRAYVHFAPSGYRSELALIAGALLIHTMMEDAFWLMAGLFNGTLKTYYVKDRSAFKIDLHIFTGILSGSEPKLANLFRDIGVTPLDYVKHWWMSLYIRVLPWPTVMRFLDAIISEGPRYMFISALAVLTLSRDRLLALPRNKKAVLDYLHHLPQDSLLLPDNFMRACDAVKLRDEDLKKMRTSVKEKIATGTT